MNQENTQLQTEYKYLSPLKKEKLQSNDPKWSECKIEGKNIPVRSYAQLVRINNILYLHGGYQLALGALPDFYSMDFKASSFIWKPVKCSGHIPGPRFKHHCSVIDQNIFLFGGQQKNQQNTNDMYIFNAQKNDWKKLKQNHTYPPPIDSAAHCQNKNKWYIFGGYFGGNIGMHSNYLYEYDYESNKFTLIYPTHEMLASNLIINSPAPREGSSITSINNLLFVFGGTNGQEKFNDLWHISPESEGWTKVQPKNNNICPLVRNGHVMQTYKNKLILFGGFHDLTYELDDLFYFDYLTLSWVQVEEESYRKTKSPNKSSAKNLKTKPQPEQQSLEESRMFQVKTKRVRSLFKQEDSPLKKRENSIYKLLKQTNDKNIKETSDTLILAHQKQSEEKKQRELAMKKQILLKNFLVPEEQKNQYEPLSPSSELMKNSLFMIGNPKQDLKLKTGKLTEFGKTTFSRFLQPILASEKLIRGKKPSARDGHAVTILGNDMIIFGGDRHQICFNDLHIIDLSMIK